jgi:hypothetical protein
MEGISALSQQPVELLSSTNTTNNYYAHNLQINTTILQSMSPGGTDKVSVGYGNSGKAVGLTARQIVDKINELIAPAAQKYGWKTAPEVPSPEEAAERIVTHVAGLYQVYKDQHPELDDEEMLERFMAAVRKGVETGYGDAVKILDGFGAFGFDGVQDRVTLTKSLIDDKINAFETQKREDLGLTNATSAETTSAVSSTLLGQSGAVLANS